MGENDRTSDNMTRLPGPRPPDAHCWFNPRFGRYFATPVEGPWADELFGQGDTAEEALDSIVEGLRKRGAL
jgi:hypothetical protein